MDLDSRPVGGGAGVKPFDGATVPEEDFRSCTVSDLVTHGNWKARKEGFEKVQGDPEKHKKLIIDSLKRIAAEGNAMVQEAAIDALAAVAQYCDDAERDQLAEGSLPFIVEKGITGRPKAVQASQSFVSALVQEGCAKSVFAALLPAFVHRTPKNRLAAAQLTASLVGDYGTQQLPTKEILKAMQPLFNDANAQVRKEAVALCCQCYRYIGASIKGFLTDLRDVQLQELQKQFESVKVGGAPPKSIRGCSGAATKEGAAAVKPIASLTGDEEGGVVDDAGFRLLDDSPVISKLPKKFFRVALNKETSWQTRVEYVNEHLLPLLAAPRLRAKEDYHELASMMKEYLVDPQAPLMLLGFKMIQECARGLRSDFAPYARTYVSPLLDKLKDKKLSVQLHVLKTLEKLVCFNCVTMDQCNDEIDQALQSKNPTQRTAIVNFCLRMVDVLGDKSRYAKLGRSTAMLTRLVNDEKPPIRDIAYVLLDKLIQAFGEAPYKSVLATLDDNQRHNMAAAVARGAPGVGPRGASNPPSLHASGVFGATPSSSPAKKLPRLDDNAAQISLPGPPSCARTASANVAPLAARRLSTSCDTSGGHASRMSSAQREGAPSAIFPAAKLSSDRAAPVRGSLGGSSPGGGAAATPSRNAVEDGIALESSLPPKMEAVTTILGLLGGDNSVLDMVRSTEWSRRQEGVTKLLTMVRQWTPAQATRGINYLVVYVRAHPSFQEPIFQVFHLIAQLFQEAVRKATTLSPGAGYAVVSGLTPRLSEAKNKPLVREVCELIAQKLGTRFVVRHMLDTATMAKTPKLVQEVCEYVREAVQRQPDSEESEVDMVDVRGVLLFVRAVCTDINNAGVRQETVLLLAELRGAGRGTAAIDKCAASLPPPLPVMYEREVGKLESSRPSTSGAGAPLPPPRVNVGGSTAAATAVAPASAPAKRVRTSSQSPGPGTRGRVSMPSPHKPPMAHRRTVSGDGDSPLIRHSASGRTSVPLSTSQSHVSTGHNGSAGPSPRASLATASSPPPLSLRPILHEITFGADWRDRLAGVHHAEEFVEETPRPLPTHCAVPLLKALQSRFDEVNKNVVVEVLRFVPVVVGAASPGECSTALRKLAPGVLAMLGDQKTALREEARNVAFLAMRVVGLEAMLPFLQKPLASESNMCRQNVLEMMVSGFEQMAPEATLPRAGMQPLIPAVINSMMDRILEVRVIAEQVLGWMIGVVGEDFILQCVQRLKPAEQQVVKPAVERQLEHQRHSALDAEKAAEQTRSESTPLFTNLNGTLSSLYDNEESRRTTPRVTSQASSGAGPAAAAATAAEPPHRRGSVNALRESRGSVQAATQPKKGGVAQLSTAALEQVVTNSKGGVEPIGAAPTRERSPVVSTKKEDLAARSAPAAKSTTADLTRIPDTVSTTPRTKSMVKAGGAAVAKVPPTPLADASPPLSKGASVSVDSGREVSTIREIFIGLRSATPDVAQTMCSDFNRHLRAGVDCGTPEVIQAMVERLYENTQNFDVGLAEALIESLTALFTTPQCTSRCHTQLLERIIGAFFDCLLSERFSLHERVIKALNVMTLKMLEGCRADDVFGALLSRLTSYSGAYLASGHKSDLKYIQLTVKCIMRVDLEKVSADTTVLYCHEYLLQHPPSAFRNLDDVPIRTVKTILQSATKRHGASLLATAERLVGPQNLVAHFIRACLDMQEKAAKDKGQNEQQAIEESCHEQRASQSPTPPAKEKTTTVAAAAATTGTTPLPRAAMPTPRKRRPSVHTDPHVMVKAAPATATGNAGGTGGSGVTQSLSPPAPTASRRTPVKTHPQKTAATSTPNHSGRGSGTAHSSPLPSTTHGTPRTVTTLSVATPTKGGSGQGDVTKELTDIFARIRNHVTSADGIDKLYTFLKTTTPNQYDDAFKLQFNRCSEAFRLYIKRKLERKVEEDTTKPTSFQLPAVVLSLS